MMHGRQNGIRSSKGIENLFCNLHTLSTDSKPAQLSGGLRRAAVMEKVEALVRDLPTNFPDPVISPEIRECLGKITEFHHSPGRIRDEAINRFTATELMEMASLFDSFEKPPLTDEQRHALICDDDATLVLAGAGSGKTSVITAKAAYLIIQKIRKPSEVLLMAFGNDAAREMSKRITKYCDADIAVQTFHSWPTTLLSRLRVEGHCSPSMPLMRNRSRISFVKF